MTTIQSFTVPASDATVVTNKKILVVDDSQTVRHQVATVLQHSGFEVIEAADGADAIQCVRKGGIDCIICDVNMPVLNGIDMVKNLKQDPAFQSLPIVMLTTEGSKEMIANAKAAGASGWIVKPFKGDMLVAAVVKLTSKS